MISPSLYCYVIQYYFVLFYPYDILQTTTIEQRCSKYPISIDPMYLPLSIDHVSSVMVFSITFLVVPNQINISFGKNIQKIALTGIFHVSDWINELMRVIYTDRLTPMIWKDRRIYRSVPSEHRHRTTFCVETFFEVGSVQ